MFVPVACSECGKPFQVPEDTVGRTTACPWCRAAVLALPAGLPAETREPAPAPAAPAAPATPQPELLSLDDAPPVLTGRRPARRALRVSALVLIAVAVTTVTLFFLRYKEGHRLTTEWRA